MKKTVLGMLGLAGACAACCTLPLVLPLLAAAWGGGLASLIGWSPVQAVIVAAGAGVLVVGAGLWRLQRKAAAKTCDVSCVPSCGCSSGGA